VRVDAAAAAAAAAATVVDVDAVVVVGGVVLLLVVLLVVVAGELVDERWPLSVPEKHRFPSLFTTPTAAHINDHTFPCRCRALVFWDCEAPLQCVTPPPHPPPTRPHALSRYVEDSHRNHEASVRVRSPTRRHVLGFRWKIFPASPVASATRLAKDVGIHCVRSR